MTMEVITFFILWIICGIINYGLTFAYLQREFPRIAKKGRDDDDVSFSMLMSVTGFLGLFILLILGWYKHGFKFK